MTNEPLPASQPENPISWNDLGEGRTDRDCLGGDSAAGRSPPHRRAIPRCRSRPKRSCLPPADEGVFEIKGTFNAFDSIERFLAVHVETAAEHFLIFRSKQDPQITIRFLDAFRQLCSAGLVMHHLFREFSLTRAGL